MSSLSPKPIITHMHHAWKVSPGMTFAVVEDIERRVWIVESCPVGTRYWNLEQAAALKMGAHTRAAWHAAVETGRRLIQASKPATDLRVSPFKELNSEPRPTAARYNGRQAEAEPRRIRVRSQRTPTNPRTMSGV